MGHINKEKRKIEHFIEGKMYAKDIISLSVGQLTMFEHSFLCSNHMKSLFHENDLGKKRIRFGLSFDAIKDVYCSHVILLHGMFSFKRLLFLFLQPWLWSKSVWIVWGGDLYIHDKEKKTVVEKIGEYLKSIMIKDFLYILTIVEGDYTLVKDWYGYNGEHALFKYPLPMQFNNSNCVSKNNNVNDSEVVKIVLGNSATESNNHFEALDLLSKYRNENIIIYIPLSYGSENFIEYRSKVIEYATSIFKREQIVPILETLDGCEYTKLMSEMNVAIYNNNRQQAMGNISIMLSHKTKVYLRSSTTMWRHYKENRFIVYDIKDIGKLDFRSFSEYSEKEAKFNHDLFYARNNLTITVNLWKDIFNRLCTKR